MTVKATKWRVRMVVGPAREFIDLQTLCGEYYQLTLGFIEKLQTHIKAQTIYRVHSGIILESTPQLTAPFIILLATQTGLTVGLLGDLTETEGLIVGVWPRQLVKLLKSDPQVVTTLLYVIVERPEEVQSLQLLL